MKPGEVHDKNGVPVYPGDLLKTYHFTGPRRKKFYLYHTAVLTNGSMQGVPTSHLEPTRTKGGGTFWLKTENLANSEVISGHGPGECLDWTERKRVKVTT
jgi:hypothetical protein